MTPEEKKALKAKAHSLAPFMSIGKNGITDNSIMQIQNYLQAHKLGKLKISRDYCDEVGKHRTEVANELATQANVVLVDVIGFTAILWKR